MTLTLALSLVLIVSFAPWAAQPVAAGVPAHAEVPIDVPTPPEMIYMPGGAFEMGFAQGYEDEKPVRKVFLSPFLIDRHEVTNQQFDEFVQKTGYQTQAQRDGYAWCYIKGQSDFATVDGADWRHPQGPSSTIEGRMDHPVVCVSWVDAVAYAAWAGKRLPTEAQWEYAATRGGRGHVAARLDGPARPQHTPATDPVMGDSHTTHDTPMTEDGSSINPHPSHEGHALADLPLPTSGQATGVVLTEANVWQGTWPADNRLTDGYFYTSPVGRFAPDTIGPSDMIGNVWEWTSDWYAADAYTQSPSENPTGAATGDKRVARGGSWFCSPNYCGAYNSHYRGASPPTHAFNNVGFRCVSDVPAGSAHASAKAQSR
jgi:sulfatase modifying factor 1